MGNVDRNMERWQGKYVKCVYYINEGGGNYMLCLNCGYYVRYVVF